MLWVMTCFDNFDLNFQVLLFFLLFFRVATKVQLDGISIATGRTRKEVIHFLSGLSIFFVFHF